MSELEKIKCDEEEKNATCVDVYIIVTLEQY